MKLTCLILIFVFIEVRSKVFPETKSVLPETKSEATVLEATDASQCFSKGVKIREDGVCESVWDEYVLK